MANLSADGGGAAGERVIAPSRRPDGSLRKEIRIRAGYTPQDEVAIYQPKGAQLRKGPDDVPPGYDPVQPSAKPKTKAAKKNEKRKEKKQQQQQSATPVSSDSPADTESGVLSEKLSALSVSKDEQTEESSGPSTVELEKKIRALKKKIRLQEGKQSATPVSAPEQAEKTAKLEGWRQELQELEAALAH